jgi:hypothetical protein
LRHETIGRDRGATAQAQLLWLLGQPHLSDYLDFVANKVVGGKAVDPHTLVEQWRAVNDLYYEMEQGEAGIADAITCLPIESELEIFAEEVRQSAWFKSSFDDLPSRIEKVELDKLILSQNHVELASSREAEAMAADLSDPEALFRFCLPLDRPQPPVRVQRVGSSRFILSSPSTDFRAHHCRMFRPEEISTLTSSGPIAGMIGLMFGFGSNFVTAIRSGSRVLLQNGYHRAYTLKSLGHDYCYCVVEDVTRKDELRLTATSDVADDPEFYFAAKRPPIMRDFFDPRLTTVLDVLPTENLVEIEIKSRSSTAVDWSSR